MSFKIQTITGSGGSSSTPYAYFQIAPSAAAGTFFAYAYGNNIQCYTSGYVGISGSPQIKSICWGGTNGNPNYANLYKSQSGSTSGNTYLVINCTGAYYCTITFSASGTNQFQGTFAGWSSSTNSVP